MPVLVNASGVGYYGDTRERTIDETEPPGDGFLAQLCQDWEGATEFAEQEGVRVVLARTGLVLAPGGGLLSRLRPLFSLGLGARLGNGRQYMPWISLEDQARALLFAIAHDELSGAVQLHRAGPGHQRRVHRGAGPCGQPPDTADHARIRTAAHCSESSPTRACSVASAPFRQRWSARGLSSTTTPSAKRWPSPPPKPASSVRAVAASIRSATTPIDVQQLGTVDYQTAWQLQRELADARVTGGPDTLLLLQHPSVYTAGRRTLPEERPNPRLSDTPVIDTDRGGKITWHGPGQLVGYPIIGLAEPLDVVNFVRRLEESLIKVCAGFGLVTGRVEGRSGVWVPPDGVRPARKIGAIGIRVSRATTLHGFALNCDCDLGAFSLDRAVRHRRCRRDVTHRRAGPSGSRRGRDSRRWPRLCVTRSTAGWR